MHVHPKIIVLERVDWIGDKFLRKSLSFVVCTTAFAKLTLLVKLINHKEKTMVGEFRTAESC